MIRIDNRMNQKEEEEESLMIPPPPPPFVNVNKAHENSENGRIDPIFIRSFFRTSNSNAFCQPWEVGAARFDVTPLLGYT